ncbi:MAG TPA: multidrug effflux MFS transporter [Stellaceae bacterium]|jgi:DHA1 family bicyclomycin/chloramphenicol resistance-like MFS transporter
MSASRRPGALFAIALGAVTLIGPLAIHLFLPVMAAVKSSFAISDALVEFTFSITLFTMAVVTLVYGSLSDRYGRRPVLLGGLSLFVIGSGLSAIAGSVEVLIAARLVQAIGAGCGLTLSRAIARDAYGPEALVKAIAYLTMAYTLGPMIAPPLGGILMDSLGWRSAFWFALLVGAAILAGAYFVLFETRSRRDAGPQAPVFHHYAALLRQGRFVAYVLQSGFMSLAFFALAAASPLLMKDLLGQSATEYGFYFMLFPLGYMTGNWISSHLSGRAPIDHMVLLGSIIAVLVIAGQTALIIAGFLSPLMLFLPGGMISFSQGLSLPNAQAGAMRVAPALAGTAAGLGVFAQMFMSAVAAELYGIFANGTPLPMIVLTLIGAMLSLGAALAAFALGRRVPVAAAAH